MKKILITVNHFYPKRGGLESYNFNLATFLAKKGYEVHVATNNTHNVKREEVINNFKIHRLPCKDILPDVFAIPTLKGFMQLKRIKFDVIISNTRFFPLSWLAAFIALIKIKPLIHIEHGNTFVQHPKKIVKIISRISDMILGRFVYKKAKMTVGVSKPCTLFAKRLGARKTKVIPNSIIFDEFKQEPTLNTKCPIIICLGRLIEAKGFQDVIKALKPYNCKLYIIGDGPYKKELKRLARKNKINTTFFGNLDPKEYKELFKQASLFINPSYAEGLPTSILEAGAMGVPVIATDVGGTREIIKHEYNGYLINPKSIFEMRFYINKVLYGKSSIANNLQKDIYKRFNWSSNIQKVILVVEKIA